MNTDEILGYLEGRLGALGVAYQLQAINHSYLVDIQCETELPQIKQLNEELMDIWGIKFIYEECFGYYLWV